MASADETRKAKESQACSTAETFARLYYDRMDSKRHLVGKLYLDSAVLSWNGNKVRERERDSFAWGKKGGGQVFIFFVFRWRHQNTSRSSCLAFLPRSTT